MHLSAPYHVWSDTESLCALTCHEIHDSLTSTHNFGYHSESQLALKSSQTILQEVYEAKTASRVVELAAIYSASAVLRATEFYFLLY